MEKDRIRIPVEFRFEYSDKKGRWIYRPYVVFGKNSDKIEIGAEFTPMCEGSDYKFWNFKILGKRYGILFDGVPVMNEKNHRIEMERSVMEYIDFRLEMPKSPWIRLP